MNVIACALAALLASQGPASAATTGGASCDVTDNRCKAERFERQAAQASSPKQRALYLHAAYRSYMGLYKETADARDLCEARRTFDQSLAVEGLSADQRASFEEGRAELEARERKANARCRRAARPQARAASSKSVEGTAPKTSPRSTAPAVVEPDTQATGRDEPTVGKDQAAAGRDEGADLLPVSAAPRSSRPPPLERAVQPRDPSPPSPPPAPAPLRPGRPLLIAGGVTLGLGLSLVGLAGYAGHRARVAHREGVELHEEVQGPPDDEARATDVALEREYRRMGTMALGTAIAGGVAVLVGTALVAVGGRRVARFGSSTAFVPVFGGLAFHARF